MVKKITKQTNFWILTIILTLCLWFFKPVVLWIDKVLPFINQLYFFALCVGTAMYLANKLK